MINKVFASIEQALADIRDGASVMIGGFGDAGTPRNLVQHLISTGIKDLTIIANGYQAVLGIDSRRVKKVVMSNPTMALRVSQKNPLEERILSGEIEVEVVPQGTFVERVRAGGAGIPAFYCPTGVGTVVAQGKERRVFAGREYILEHALTADFALIKACEGDTMGNLSYRKAMRNFNTAMVTAAKITIAEVEKIVEAGELDPEMVHTPGIFVDRIVQAVPRRIPFMGVHKR